MVVVGSPGCLLFYSNWFDEEKKIVAVDTETNSLDPHEANLVGISLCYSPGVACYIPLEHATEKVMDKNLVLEKLKIILENKNIKKNWPKHKV